MFTGKNMHTRHGELRFFRIIDPSKTQQLIQLCTHKGINRADLELILDTIDKKPGRPTVADMTNVEGL